MATITHANVALPNVNVQVVKWETLTTTNDVGDGVEMSAWPDRAVQVVGTFGAGGTLAIEGSIDGTNYTVLTDPQGNALNITSTKIEAVTELVRYIRPSVEAGDGTTDLDVWLILGGRTD